MSPIALNKAFIQVHRHTPIKIFSITVDSISTVNHSRLEARALRLNSWGGLAMAALGLGFAVITKSEAILLDGFLFADWICCFYTDAEGCPSCSASG